jgi:hypothetical protein
VSELFADLELVLDLLDEADVLGIYPLYVLQSELSPGRGIVYAVDRALGTLTQHIDNVIVEQFFCHASRFHLGTVLPQPDRWNSAGVLRLSGPADEKGIV